MSHFKIALTGKMRSGKDTVGEYLTQGYDFTRFAFGDELKRYAHELFGESDAKQRELYQWFGQTMRQRDPDIWVRKCFEEMAKEQALGNPFDFVITDMRQPNEYQRCRAEGFTIIRVTAPDELRLARAKEAGDQFTAADLTHETESHIDGFAVDYELVNDGTKAELLRKVDELMGVITKEGRKEVSMTIKKQVIVLSVVYNEEETYAKSAAEAISHSLFNEEGMIEWDFKVKKEETLSADIRDEDLKD